MVTVMLGAALGVGCPARPTPAQPTPSPSPAPRPADVPPDAAGEAVVRSGELVLPGPLVFATGTAELEPASEPALRALQAFLDAHPDVTLLRIEGHVASGVADDPDDPMAAVMFSGERAFSVGRWLTARGVACARLLAAGFGHSKPVADDRTPEGRAANTRITLVVAALRDHAIGGMPTDGGAPAAVDVCGE